MKAIYFKSGGKENTDSTLEIAKEYADNNNIENIVVASTTGFTATEAAKMFKDKNLIIVTHVTGFKEDNQQQFPEELRKKLESQGVKVLTTAHAMGGLNRLVEDSVGSIIANTLRMFCQGVKVAVEIGAEAVDAGLIRTSEDAICIAGTGRGADTALVIEPANSRNLFDMRIKKVLAKPV
jgi:hypothetical protein